MKFPNFTDALGIEHKRCLDCGQDSKNYYRCYGCNIRCSLRKKQEEREKLRVSKNKI